MKIYNRIVLDFDFNVIEEDSYEYDGEVAFCDGGGGGDASSQASADAQSNSEAGSLGGWGGDASANDAQANSEAGSLGGYAGESSGYDAQVNSMNFGTNTGWGYDANANSFSIAQFAKDVGKWASTAMGITVNPAIGVSLGVAKAGFNQSGAISNAFASSPPNSFGSTLNTSTSNTNTSSQNDQGTTEGLPNSYVWDGKSFVSPNSPTGQQALAQAQAAGGTMSNTSTGGNVAASWQQKAVDYLIERGVIPNQFRDEALKRLGGIAGLEGGIGNQQDLIDKAKGSPLYAEIMSGKKAGEESILRNASATGGLRSGDVQSNFMDFNTNLENKALLESYNQELMGLKGLSGLSGETTAIAQGMSNVGNTLQEGISAKQAQDDQEERDERNTWLGIASLGVELFSDRRLKKNIKKLGKIDKFFWYSWEWNSIAEKLGLSGSSQGVIADEVLKTNPEAISIRNNFMTVNYGKLGILEVQNA